MKKKQLNESETTKATPRFKALDAVVILLVILAVVGIYFRYNLLDMMTANKDWKDYTVSFSIENVRYTTPNYIDVGDTVYCADNGEKLGVLLGASEDTPNMNLSVSPSSQVFIMDDGTMERVFYPNSESRVNASGRMLCTGSYTDDGGFWVNGSRYLSAGQTVAIQTELVTVSIVIHDIELAE